MAAVSVTRSERAGDIALIGVIVGALLGLTILCGSVYSFAENRAVAQDCVPHGHSRGVGYSWSWQPFGYTCTSDDGYSQTKLFW